MTEVTTFHHEMDPSTIIESDPNRPVPAPRETSEPREGIDEVLLLHSPLDVNSIFTGATLPSTGATSLFVGTTRLEICCCHGILDMFKDIIFYYINTLRSLRRHSN